MTDDTFDALMQRYEMGEAYKQITAAMGPSPQLLAFINFDQIDNGNLGLESMNIMDQHAQVLADIDADPALSLACESFIGRLKSTAEKIKNAITFNTHDSDMLLYLSATLKDRKSNIYVEKYAEFQKLVAIHKKTLPLLDAILKVVPRSHNLKDWDAFATKTVKLGGESDLDKKRAAVKVLRTELDAVKSMKTVDFAEGGWNAANFKSSISAYVSETKKSTSNYHIADTVTNDLGVLIDDLESDNTTTTSTVEKDGTKDENGRDKTVEKKTVSRSVNKENKLAIKGMNKAFDAVWDVFFLCQYCEIAMRRTLAHVSHHFDEDKK